MGESMEKRGGNQRPLLIAPHRTVEGRITRYFSLNKKDPDEQHFKGGAFIGKREGTDLLIRSLRSQNGRLKRAYTNSRAMGEGDL